MRPPRVRALEGRRKARRTHTQNAVNAYHFSDPRRDQIWSVRAVEKRTTAIWLTCTRCIR